MIHVCLLRLHLPLLVTVAALGFEMGDFEFFSSLFEWLLSQITSRASKIPTLEKCGSNSA